MARHISSHFCDLKSIQALSFSIIIFIQYNSLKQILHFLNSFYIYNKYYIQSNKETTRKEEKREKKIHLNKHGLT